MKHAHAEKLVFFSSLGMLATLGLMVLSLVSPKPVNLVLAMSVGQGLGLVSLAMYLLAIAHDLQKVPSSASAPEEAPGAREGAADETRPPR